jgi:antitoxin component of RelBE/YafQ-DinJ toxin-antitoxin module
MKDAVLTLRTDEKTKRQFKVAAFMDGRDMTDVLNEAIQDFIEKKRLENKAVFLYLLSAEENRELKKSA